MHQSENIKIKLITIINTDEYSWLILLYARVNTKLAYVAQENRFMTVPGFEVLQYLNADYCSRDVLICHCPSSISHSVSQNGRAS